MEVQIGEINSTVRVVDSQALLTPQLLERILREVLARLREDAAKENRNEENRKLKPAASARETPTWQL
jgi:hypothetical protein